MRRSAVEPQCLSEVAQTSLFSLRRRLPLGLRRAALHSSCLFGGTGPSRGASGLPGGRSSRRRSGRARSRVGAFFPPACCALRSRSRRSRPPSSRRRCSRVPNGRTASPCLPELGLRVQQVQGVLLHLPSLQVLPLLLFLVFSCSFSLGGKHSLGTKVSAGALLPREDCAPLLLLLLRLLPEDVVLILPLQ